jgi:sec-independent protein translocase protein TatA
MGGLGMSELVIILLIVIVIFGASRLPQLGKGLGEGIRNFKGSLKAGEEDNAKKESEQETPSV